MKNKTPQVNKTYELRPDEARLIDEVRKRGAYTKFLFMKVRDKVFEDGRIDCLKIEESVILRT